MEAVRSALVELAKSGAIELTQKGKKINPDRFKGPIRARNVKPQIRRSLSHAKEKLKASSRKFDYSLDYKSLNLREKPNLYRVGRSEQGVLLVEPYKSEILPHWKFKTPRDAQISAREITKLFREYKRKKDFIGMDMSRKFLQMGYTRARRYANHRSGHKYAANGALLPFQNDAVKAKSAEIFYGAWKKVERDATYARLKIQWQQTFG